MQWLFHFTGRNRCTGEVLCAILAVSAFPAIASATIAATVLVFAGRYAAGFFEAYGHIIGTGAHSSAAVILTTTPLLAVGGTASILVAAFPVRAGAILGTVSAVLKLICVALAIVAVE